MDEEGIEPFYFRHSTNELLALKHKTDQDSNLEIPVQGNQTSRFDSDQPVFAAYHALKWVRTIDFSVISRVLYH
jgi:hypothetical protein